MSLSQSLEYLTSLSVPLTIGEACVFLENNLVVGIILELYRQLFPDEWKASTAPLVLAQTGVVSQKVEEFLELIETHYFPIGFDEGFLDELPATIPFWPMDVDWYEMLDYGTDGIEPGLLLLASLYEPELAEELPSTERDADIVALPPIEIDWNELDRRSQRSLEPLSFLFNAMSMIDHTTENIWLDSSRESYIEILWSRENLEQLRIWFQEAEVFHRRFDALTSWLSANVEHRLEAVRLWNSCRKKTLSHNPH